MWNERFDRPEYVFGTEPNAFLKSVVKNILPGQVLSIGEGEGRNAVFLAEQGYEVTAIDLSPIGLEKAKKLADSRDVGLQTIVADIASFDFGENLWNGIISIFCHLPPDVRQMVHQKIKTGLKPGGVFIVEAYTHDQIPFGTGGPKDLRMMMSLEILQNDFDNFEFVHAQEIKRNIVEGIFHTGQSAVVQGVLKKPI